MVTGGIDGNSWLTNTTEIYSTAGVWSQGPPLPKPVWGHCVVQLDNDNTLLVGGMIDDGVRRIKSSKGDSSNLIRD